MEREREDSNSELQVLQVEKWTERKQRAKEEDQVIKRGSYQTKLEAWKAWSIPWSGYRRGKKGGELGRKEGKAE